jgi:hypothetical protein
MLAHRSSSSTVRRRNLARRRCLSDEVGLRWPAVVRARARDGGGDRAAATARTCSDSGAWRLQTGARGHGRSGRRRHMRGGVLSGGDWARRGAVGASTAWARRAVGTRSSSFKQCRRRGAWRPCGNGALPRGPGAGPRRLTGGARSSVISELKFTLKEISSN